jgi:hypothetical protein
MSVDAEKVKGSELTGSLRTRRTGIVFLVAVVVGGVLALSVAIAIAVMT